MSNNRPSLFFDNEAVLQLRQEVQRPWEKDEFWMYFVMRRFSIYLSSLLATKTKVTPNAITILGILFGLAATAIYMVGTPAALLWGLLCYQICYFLDCVDGEVARISKRTSERGQWWDIGLNYAMAMSNIAVVYGLFQSAPHNLFGLLLFLSLATAFALVLASDGAMVVFRQSSSPESVSMRKKNRVTDSVVFLFLTEIGFHFGLLPGCLLWIFAGTKLPLQIWTGYFIGTSLLKAIFKLKVVLEKV